MQQNKIMHYVFAILILLYLSYLALFKHVVVQKEKVGVLFSIWNGKTIDYLAPGRHLICRLDGYVMISGKNNQSNLILGEKIYVVVDEPIHEREIQLYRKYNLSYFPKIISPINIKDSIKPNIDTLKQLYRVLNNNPEIKKYIKIKSIKAHGERHAY